MESLNDIIGPSRRQLSTTPRHPKNIYGSTEAPQQGQQQQPPVRRPLLPEQTARQGFQAPQGNPARSQYPPRTRSVPGVPGSNEYMREEQKARQSHYNGSPTPRSPFVRPQPPTGQGVTYQQRSHQLPEPQRAQPFPMQAVPPPALPVQRYTNDYTPPQPADVIDNWEGIEEDEENDSFAMCYGDWEQDTQKAPEALVYQREIDALPERHTNFSPLTRKLPAMRDIEDQAHVTRNPRDLRMSTAPQPTPTTREVSHSHRITQPLNPQALAEFHREHAIPQENRSMRAVAPRIPGNIQTVTAPPVNKGVCRKCKGAGFLRLDVPFGHPNFGKPTRCECKEVEQREKRRRQLREMSNLNAYTHLRFETFNQRIPGVQEAFDVTSRYANNPDGWVLLVGPNGCGKTHLAVAIANQSLDAGAVVLFAVVPDLLDHLRAAFAPTANEVYDQLFAKMREAEVLILDDLGAQQSSPWANEKLFQLLNYRYNMSMPTVITANPKGLQGVDERISSRLCDSCLVQRVNFGHASDYRLQRPKKLPMTMQNY